MCVYEPSVLPAIVLIYLYFVPPPVVAYFSILINASKGFALEQNTDPVITKIIAGSFILAMIALLVYGVVIPSLTEYDEGICSPIQNAGRC